MLASSRAVCLILGITLGNAYACSGSDDGQVTNETTTTSKPAAVAPALDISPDLAAIDSTIRSVLAEVAKYEAKDRPGAAEFQAFLEMCSTAGTSLQDDGLKLVNKVRGRIPEATFDSLAEALAKLASTELGCHSNPEPDRLVNAREHLQSVIDGFPK